MSAKRDRQQKNQTILIISDMHQPYAHPDTLAFLTAVKAKYSPTEVVCIGDEIDAHAMSYHEPDPDLMSPGDELEAAIEALKPIYKLFPVCTVVESNHGSMILRKAKTSKTPRRAIKSYNDTLEAPKGWKWVDDLILQTVLGPVYFCHGKAALAGKLSSLYGCSAVQGHFHERAQIHYISTPDRLMFDMHVGCLANDKSLALQYNKVNSKRPIVSIGLIINGIPSILPMVLNRDHKWVGKL